MSLKEAPYFLQSTKTNVHPKGSTKIHQGFSSKLAFIEILIIFQLAYLKFSLEESANASFNTNN